MIRLLIGITLSEVGGSQRVVFDTIAGLPEELYAITLITSPGGALLDWITDLNQTRDNPVKIITLGCLCRNISLWDDVKAFGQILSIIRRGRFDAAHFHNSKIGIIGRLAAWIAGVPQIYYTMHGLALNPQNTGRLYGAMSFLERLAARHTTQVIFVSANDQVIGLQNHWALPDTSCLIHNGVMERSFPDDPANSTIPAACLRETLGIAADIPIIGFVARLAQPKDPLLAIRMSGRLSAAGLDHRLIIIGDGPLRAACRQLAESQEAAGRVVMLGLRDDVRALLPEMDIFCLFSVWEGLPVSILEAMSAGLPVVASKVGGIPELVVTGSTGYLLDQPNCEAAANLVQQLLLSRDLRRTLGEAGRLAALEKFTAASMVAAYRGIYEADVSHERFANLRRRKA